MKWNVKLYLCLRLKLYFNDGPLSSENSAESFLSQQLDILRGRVRLFFSQDLWTDIYGCTIYSLHTVCPTCPECLGCADQFFSTCSQSRVSSSRFCGVPACLPPGCNSVPTGLEICVDNFSRQKNRRNLEKLKLQNKMVLVMVFVYLVLVVLGGFWFVLVLCFGLFLTTKQPE